jgi:hypothetical protein
MFRNNRYRVSCLYVILLLQEKTCTNVSCKLGPEFQMRMCYGEEERGTAFRVQCGKI